MEVVNVFFNSSSMGVVRTLTVFCLKEMGNHLHLIFMFNELFYSQPITCSGVLGTTRVCFTLILGLSSFSGMVCFEVSQPKHLLCKLH